MKTHEPLSGVDTAWLRMDSPTNLMTITAVLVLEDPIDVDAFKALLDERLLGFPRFRQRVRNADRTPSWELDPHFDLDRHVQRAALPGAAGRAELKTRVGELMSTPLDRSKPLWHMELIEDYLGGSVVIARLHHCIGDGMALVQVLLSLTDEHFDPDRFPDAEDASVPVSRPLRSLFRAASGTVQAGRSLLREGARALLHPPHALHRLKQGVSVATALSKIAVLGTDSETRFKGDLQVAQRATWSGPIELVQVKRLAHTVDAKVNDVLLGAVAGAFRRYLSSHNDPTDDVLVRSLIPVNLRPPEEAFELGNRFGLVYLDLPVGVSDRLERVLSVKAQMDKIKDSAEAGATFGVLEALGYLPVEVEDRAVRLFSQKASVVMTNVPGPQEPLHLHGRRVQHVMPWVPRAGRIGIGVSVFSYDGEVRLGIASDAGLVPDPDMIVDEFEAEFDALAHDLSPASETTR